MKNRKILIIQNKILPYRIPLYQELSKKYPDLTVCHTGEPINDETQVEFEELTLSTRKLKGFIYVKSLISIARKYDIIVGMFDLKWISIWTLPLFLSRSQKFYFWGIGLSTETGLGVDRKWDFLRYRVARLAKGLIFYSAYPVKFYIDKGIQKEKLFVANNTVFTEEKISLKLMNERNSLLFFGSLTARKGLDTLLKVYKSCLSEFNRKVKLVIAGGGPYRDEVLILIQTLNLEDDVVMMGRVDDYQSKKELFQDAILTISPNQAGLSILESFSFGVPFATSLNAITGGEIFNIENGINGFKYNNSDDLKAILIQAVNNSTTLDEIGQNALDHYWNNRQITHMSSGFESAFER